MKRNLLCGSFGGSCVSVCLRVSVSWGGVDLGYSSTCVGCYSYWRPKGALIGSKMPERTLALEGKDRSYLRERKSNRYEGTGSRAGKERGANLDLGRQGVY